MIKILLINGSGGDTACVSDPVIGSNDPLSVPHQIAAVDRVEQAVDRLDGEAIDLVLLDVSDRGAAGLADIARIRERAPEMPIIVLTGSAADDLEVAALRAGAQDCLPHGDGLPPLLSRAVRFAIERNLFQSVDDRRRGEVGRQRETRGLQAICGPQPLPVTEHSFGVQSLPVKAPKDFEELINAYLNVLDQVLELDREPSEPAKARIDDALNRISDRLGMLNAGPRDVIELHKAAIGRKVDGRPSRSTIRLIEEGRLLILQLMGQLVSFYRALSWGLRVDARPRVSGYREAKLPNNRVRDR